MSINQINFYLEMMKQTTYKQLGKRIFLKKFLAIFSLSASAFVFQACYGAPTDFIEDTHFEGLVKSSATNNPIPGIRVEIKGLNRQTYTDNEGKYILFAPSDSSYTLVFTDIDSSENGNFLQKEISLQNRKNEQYFSNDIGLESF